jgi:excisionase family DNA binding protein
MSGSPSPTPEVALARAIAEFVRTEVAGQVAAALAERPAVAELLSTAEAAAHAKVTPATIWRWIAAGKLPEHRAGREVRIARADQLLRGGQ